MSPTHKRGETIAAGGGAPAGPAPREGGEGGHGTGLRRP